MTIINPGSGPVNNATEENAAENIKHYILDNGVEGVEFVRIPNKDYGNGRFAFLLWKNTICHEIQMPGLPLERVRFVDSEGQNIWDFPRLYVDGSSWVWKFALGLMFDGENEI
jgi:hypothetical protein